MVSREGEGDEKRNLREREGVGFARERKKSGRKKVAPFRALWQLESLQTPLARFTPCVCSKSARNRGLESEEKRPPIPPGGVLI